MGLALNLALLMCAISLTACAVPLTSAEMSPKPYIYDLLDAPKLDKKITLGNVIVDKGLGGMTPVLAEQYAEALSGALRQAGWYTTSEKATYVLDAHLTELKQPVIGFNFTVKSAADYSLAKASNRNSIYQDTLQLPCTVRFVEAVNGEVRLRRATGCAVAENITQLLNVLSEKY